MALDRSATLAYYPAAVVVAAIEQPA